MLCIFTHNFLDLIETHRYINIYYFSLNETTRIINIFSSRYRINTVYLILIVIGSLIDEHYLELSMELTKLQNVFFNIQMIS